MPKDNTSVTDFLNRIGKIESSDNYNAQHHPISYGIQQGTRAVGRYGMMPYTISELMRSRQNEGLPADPRLPGNITQDLTPGTPEYKGSSTLLANEVAARPEAQDTLASYLANKLLQKTGGDQDRAAYMWNQGHHKDPNQITPQMLDSSDYVQKFRDLYAKDEPNVPQLEEASTRKVKKFPKIRAYVAQGDQNEPNE